MEDIYDNNGAMGALEQSDGITFNGDIVKKQKIANVDIKLKKEA